MKKVFNYLIIGGALLLQPSCQKEDLSTLDTVTNSINETTTEELYDSSDLQKRLEEIDPEARKYFSNVMRMLHASDALAPETLRSIRDQTTIMKNTDEEETCKYPGPTAAPLAEKLADLNIVDAETNKSIDLSTLKKEDKDAFVDLYLTSCAETMSQKIEAMPELKESIKVENTLVDSLLKQEGVAKLDLGSVALSLNNQSTYSGVAFATAKPEGLRSFERKSAHLGNNFFLKLNEELEKLSTPKKEEQARFLSIRLSPKRSLDTMTVIRNWAKYAKTGDFVVALPDPGNYHTLLSIGAKYKVGHAGVIVQDVNKIDFRDPVLRDSVTVEAFDKGGVLNYSYTNWTTPHYIMGIQKVKVKVKLGWFRISIYKEKTPVRSEPLAYEALNYKGRNYVHWYEFPVAKWAAPHRFTCTTLVWYSAKRAYGINVSPWYSPLVTPSNLVTDDCTYIKAFVR